MNKEQRFNAKDVVGILIWKRNFDRPEDPAIPCIRLYDPRDPKTGWALPLKPDGSHVNFKDYRLREMVDPSIKILDEHFEFVEKENGECYFDFSLKALGKACPKCNEPTSLGFTCPECNKRD